MVIAAIDPGTHRCGFCVIAPRGSRIEMMEIGTIATTAKTRAGRLRQVYDRIDELFTRHHPTEVVVERVYVGKNAQSAIVLGEARGIALICADRVGAQVFEYTAPEAKKALTMNGLSGKDGVQRAVMLLLGLKALPGPDTADAVALALLHASQVRIA